MAQRRAVIVVLVLAATAGGARAEDLAVVVHADRQVRLSVSEVARIYLKQQRFWSDGGGIVPVNRDWESDARKSFVRAVFGEAARNLAMYWNRRYFGGVLPPATLASDEAVKRFVSGERLAIGYLSPAMVDDSVRVVLHLDDPDPPRAPARSRP